MHAPGFEAAPANVARGAPQPAAPARRVVSNALLARVAQAPATPTLFRAWTGVPFVNYGAVNADGTATAMQAELHGPQGYGSKPSVKPAWWPVAPPAAPKTAKWFTKYMVQGHLLNDNLGGPGNTLSNLTPLTKTGNSRHFQMAEDHIKKELANGMHAAYEVTVQHRNGVSGAALGVTNAAVALDIDTNYCDKIPEYMEADVEIYDPAGNFQHGESWIVRNEKEAADEF